MKTTASKAATPVAVAKARVVEPGEVVHPAPGVELWLTPEGKYRSTPDGEVVVDDLNATSYPGAVTMEMGPAGDRFFISGTYRSVREASAVKVVTVKGTMTGTVVHLEGEFYWGGFYATGVLPDPRPDGLFAVDFVRSVTVYDNAGRALASWIK